MSDAYMIVLEGGIGFRVQNTNPSLPIIDMIKSAKENGRLFTIPGLDITINPDKIIMISPESNVASPSSSIVVPNGMPPNMKLNG